MKKILVTGGCGFIGSNFVRHILKKYPDYVIVNLDALTYCGNVENLSDVEQDPELSPRYSFVKGDITDRDAVRKALEGVSVVVHFAAESHVDNSIKDPFIFTKTNVLGTHVLLEEAHKKGDIERFVHISTDEVYGSIAEGSFSEKDMLEPRSPYSSTKAAAELLARSFFTTFGFPVIVTRSSNNFGPYQYPEKVIPLFITNLIDGKKVPLYGDGLNVRDWIHVVDNCEAIDLVLHEGTTGEIYNIGGGEELPNIVLTKKLLALLGKGEESIQHVQDRLGHDRRYSIHTSKVSALGWKPRFSFDEALKQTVEWYQQNEKWWRPLQQRRETVVSSNNEENVSKSNEEKDEDFENVLIIGSSGFLGRKLFDVFSTSEKYSVMGTYYSAEEHEGLIPLDITDVSATRQIITMADPSIILLPGSMTHVDACETDREKAHAINVVGVQNVVSVCKERGIKLVFYSTDYVFDGEKGKYSEEDPANPLGYYGETKILGEEIVRQLSDALICRVAILYGNSSVKKVPFVSWVINSLREGKQIHVYTDLHGSPTLIDDIASATEKLLDNGCVGTYHISGPDCISRYEMALTIAKVFGFDTNLILPSLSSEKPMKARRPKDSSLDITKLKKEGMFTTSFEEGILVLKKQLGLLEDLQ